MVIAGKNKGSKGKILSVAVKANRVMVEGVAMHKKHLKAKTRGGVGELISREGYIHSSNVQLLDPKSGKVTRTGSKKVGDKKVRIAKKSGQEI